tara:strand:+ start:1164 stop:2405 length:1242 start_codon:yes stop_codon:yes gene_type:complete
MTNYSDIKLSISGSSGSMTSYTTAAELPTTGLTSGDQAFVTSTGRLFISNGSGWYNVALINQAPYWIEQPNVNYPMSISGASVVVNILASDSDGLVPSYTATADSDFNQIATMVTDSEGADGTRFIITPIDSENGTAVDGSGTVTFQATDGVNQASVVSTFSISFALYEGNYFYIANSSYAAEKDTNSITANFTQGSSVTLATHDGVQGHIGGSNQNSTGTANNGALLWDLTNSGGFDASTDLIVTSFYLPSFTSGVTFGIGLYDDTANNGVTFSIYNGNFGIVKSTGSFFDIASLPVATWIIMAAGGGNSLLSPSATASSSGLRFWPANTSGGTTLGSEYSAAIGGNQGFSAQTLTGPGLIYYNGGNPSGMNAGNRSAMEYNVRSVQIYYNQTTSGRTIEQIVADHQNSAFS